MTGTIIIGSGLAGATLAWHLHRLGDRVLIIDRDEASTSSRIAAGLITPITGKRLSKSWRLEELHPAAEAFYRSIEAITGASFYRRQCIHRLFQYPSERDSFRQRLAKDFAEWAIEAPAEPQSLIQQDLGGFQMQRGGQLRVAEYLQTTRTYFQELGQFRIGDVNFAHDIAWSSSGVTLAKFDLHTARLVCCEGIAGQHNPWFPEVSFKAAKGEILTLRIPDLPQDRVWNRGVWLAPIGGDYWRCGATYTWHELNTIPTTAGRADIERRLKLFLNAPYDVVGHDAGVRPIIAERHPLIGRHRQWPQLSYFNGLSSKGSLMAPFFAEQLARHLLFEEAIDAEVNIQLLEQLP